MKQAVLIDRDNRVKHKFEGDIKGIFDYVVLYNDTPPEVEGYSPIEVYDLSVLHGLYIPKYENGEWVEGATQEEIDLINHKPPQLPSPEERLEALELAMLELLA